MATINREALVEKERLDMAFKMFDRVKIFIILFTGWQWDDNN